MIVDLKEKPTETGVFEIKGGGKVSLRLLSDKDVREIVKITKKVVAEYPLLKDPDGGPDKYQRFEVVTFDDEVFDEMNYDRTILEWSGIETPGGEQVPVTKQNKVLLMKRSADFYDAVTAGRAELKKRATERRDAEEKNESPT